VGAVHPRRHRLKAELQTLTLEIYPAPDLTTSPKPRNICTIRATFYYFMQKNIVKQSESRCGTAPVILYANHIQLAGRETIRNGSVGSRMLLRCLEGEGPVVTGGQRIRLHAGDWLFLPWHHTIEYECRHCRSFFLEGIHLVPRLPPNTERPLLFQVAYGVIPPPRPQAPIARIQRCPACLPDCSKAALQPAAGWTCSAATWSPGTPPMTHAPNPWPAGWPASSWPNWRKPW
jgi:hypothetical protein